MPTRRPSARASAVAAASVVSAASIVAAAFVVSRIVYWILGVRFDAEPLRSFLQVLDPALLRDHLAQSLLYLHGQPPLFNLFCGLMLKAFGANADAAFHVAFLLFGLLLALGMVRLMIALGVRPRLAVAVTILFVASPSAIVLENQLFYDYPLTLLLVLSAVALHRFAARHRIGDGLVLFGLLAAIVAIRSLFHPVWLVAVLALLLLLHRSTWKRTLAVAALPMALALGIYVKNLVLFDGFFGSSWLGANLHSPVTRMVPMPEREEMAARGLISRYSLTEFPLSDLDTFVRLGYRLPPETGIPALDEVRKSTGYANTNHLAYIELSRHLFRDGLVIMRERPGVFPMSYAKATVAYFYPTSKVWSFNENRERIETIDRIYNHVVYGQVLYDAVWGLTSTPGSMRSRVEHLLSAGLLMLVGYPLLFVWAARRALRQRRARGVEAAEAATLLYMLMTIALVTLVGNALSLAENSRYRFTVDPFFLAMLGMFVESLLQRREARRLEAQASPADATS